MEGYITYTDKVVDEILKGIYKDDISDKELVTFINKKYFEKRFTLIGVRREKRFVAQRINENASNKFEAISAAAISIMAGITSFLFIDRISGGGTIVKLILPLITIAALAFLFSATLSNMKDKGRVYSLCNYRLTLIEKNLEEEYTRVEMRKMMEDEYVGGSILNPGNMEDNEEEDKEEQEEIDQLDEFDELAEENDEDGEDGESQEIEIESFNFDFPEMPEDEIEETEEENYGVA